MKMIFFDLERTLDSIFLEIIFGDQQVLFLAQFEAVM